MFLVFCRILSIENMLRNLIVEILMLILFYKWDKDIYSLNFEYVNLFGFFDIVFLYVLWFIGKFDFVFKKDIKIVIFKVK